MSIIKTPNISATEMCTTLGITFIRVSFTNLTPQTLFKYTIHVYNAEDSDFGNSIDVIQHEEYIYADTTTVTVDLYASEYPNVQNVAFHISCEAQYTATLSNSSIAEMCENASSERLSAVTYISTDTPYVVLKAFCNMPGTGFSDVYMYWETSTDGITWNELNLSDSENVNISTDKVKSEECAVFVPKYDTVGNKVDDSSAVSDAEHYVPRTVWQVSAKSSTDEFLTRPDALRILSNNAADTQLYRATMLTIRPVTESEAEYISAPFKENLILGQSVYSPIYSQNVEYLYSDISGASKGDALYYGSTVYMFNNPDFKNNLIASNPGEVVKPISKLTPVEALEEAYITSVVPWKDYLICFTKTSTHLISKITDGFQAATVNAHIGVPQNDSQCCVSTLNGVIFKSYNKLYMLYPNIYASTDSVTNITEISQPVEDYISSIDASENLPFAISTSTEYILMFPQENCTKCVRYDYNARTFTCHEYPVVFISYKMFDVSDVRLFGYYTDYIGNVFYGEYLLDADYSSFNNVSENFPYVDILNGTAVNNLFAGKTIEDLLSSGDLLPISFELDSGQKADSLSDAKQFVESKFNLSTLHEKDAFPMRVVVHIDGTPHLITQEVSTDSAFWKQNIRHAGTLSSDFVSSNSDVFNVFRQMFIRYSGKGRSIRHIIDGKSLYPFKIYEIDYRYRNLNVKR